MTNTQTKTPREQALANASQYLAESNGFASFAAMRAEPTIPAIYRAAGNPFKELDA
jgi:hypothetical protein